MKKADSLRAGRPFSMMPSTPQLWVWVLSYVTLTCYYPPMRGHFRALSEIIDEDLLPDLRERKPQKVLSACCRLFDFDCFVPGSLTLIVGGPTVLRAMVAGLADLIAVKQQRPAGFFSGVERIEHVRSRLISARSLVPLDQLQKSRLTSEELLRARQARHLLDESPLRLSSTHDALRRYGVIDIETLWAFARREQRRQGLDLLLVDHVGIFTDSNEMGPGRRSVLSRKMKQQARELGIPIVAVVELLGTAWRGGYLPNLGELDSLNEHADSIISLEPSKSNLPGEVWDFSVRKSNYGASGVKEVLWVPEFQTFSDFLAA